MHSGRNILLCYNSIIFIWFTISPASINAIFFDWAWTSSKNQESHVLSNGPFPSIPFEYNSEDEKFLEEASKFTDLMKSSALDLCQHKAILQIKTSCNSMTEEELAKMSVNLLNCQSQVDGRKIFPCSEAMSLKECTKDMDANMWNAYHLMNNRARAVCLASRRTQFHALSEMTVNKLMTTAHDQIKKMANLLEGQEKLESITLGTLNSVEKGHAALIKQQDALKTAQKKIQDFVSFNLEQLTTEKALIAAGNQELAKITEIIKEKLDEANQQLQYQSEERTQNHQQLLKDIEALQMQAHDIFHQIGVSTDKLLAQHDLASKSYKSLVDNLLKINETVYYLLNIMDVTRNEINDKFYWIQNFLGGTGNHIDKLMTVTFHTVYLLMGMLFASFLNFSCASRALLTTIVPLNLFVSLDGKSKMALDFSQMTITLMSAILSVAVIQKLFAFFYGHKKMIVKSLNKDYLHSEAVNGSRVVNGQTEKISVNYGNKSRNNFGLNKLICRINQLLGFAFGWVRSRMSIEESSKISSTRKDDIFNGSSVLDDQNGTRSSNWNEYTPIRDTYSQSTNSRVNEWLRSKADYHREDSPSSTNSGSRNFYCSAVCRSGRRCKNPTYLGSGVCHKHFNGHSMTS